MVALHVVDKGMDSKSLVRSVVSHGAVLVRGLRDVDEFASLASSLGSVREDIACSAGPRKPVGKRGVFTANDAPPHETICMHHEMAQCSDPPEFVLFYCDVPPCKGGYTPYISSSNVCDHFVRHFPDVASMLREEGVRYRRVYPSDTNTNCAVGKSWKERFPRYRS